ncbi:UNVERIFIED_CONTAM: hypothetical protein PYX00_007324 [Menopon gallinae]|uniref:ATP synthase subunit s, mitochondrial n=1 Tax=Menopon gallinae TaxID=328185 RepID=A0AAW2HIN0_9NEOP
MIIKSFRKLKPLQSPGTITNHRNFFFWTWFYNLFNSIDHDRLEKIGPDRNCAEWILKNGGSVKFKIQNEIITDYTELPPEASALANDQLIEIYCKGASINDYGFPHFKGCHHISKISFISCKLIGDTGLERLQLYLKNSLRHLVIQSCHTITDEGILFLTELRGLQSLSLHDLRGVAEKEKCTVALKGALKQTQCNINM